MAALRSSLATCLCENRDAPSPREHISGILDEGRDDTPIVENNFDTLLRRLVEERKRELAAHQLEVLSLQHQIFGMASDNAVAPMPFIQQLPARPPPRTSKQATIIEEPVDVVAANLPKAEKAENERTSTSKHGENEGTSPRQTAESHHTSISKFGGELWDGMDSDQAHPRKPNMAQKVVGSRFFSIFFNTVILLNCVFMGLEAHTLCDETFGGVWLPVILNVAEHIFTALFTIELLSNIVVHGLRSIWPNTGENRWNFLDAFLVAIGILSTWLIPIVSLTFDVEAGGSVLRPLTVLRAVRIFRLARVVRTSPMFREAWLLVRGLGDSSTTLFWTFVVIFFVTYIFAIFGSAIIVAPLQERLNEAKQIINPSENDEATILDLEGLVNIYGGIDQIMYKLIQALLVDSIHAEMDRLIGYIWYSWIFFYVFFGIAVLVLMNLVTAILVDNAVLCSQQDQDFALQQKDRERKKELAELHELFMLIDADGSGTISWEEFNASFKNETVAKKWALLDFEHGECKEIFDLLDDGSDGGIDLAEFFDGLAHLRGQAMSRDILRMEKMLKKLKECFPS